jgi:AcrR family transcriptional regulator
MPPRQRPTQASRSPLTRERVLRTATALADRDGIEALTMRRLGQELGVEAMSLYNHVANKDDLLAGILDLVVGELDLPADAADWRSALRSSALDAHAILRRHPWSPGLLVLRPEMTGASRWRQMDFTLGQLRSAGFSVERTHHAFHVLDSYVIGFTLQEVSFPAPTGDLAALGERFLATFPAAEHPHLAEHIRYHIDTGVFDEGDFEFGLDLILDSLAAMERRRGTGAHHG